ncbi:hypothetical protein CEE45_01225 [Candidatus Heimdallarchaeota archaeon B3_Heim]|nr:MAG: hypothetical protein CEE45_01225 [Candidatus Heimdallarchaeota archaeon B3_Heim]
MHKAKLKAFFLPIVFVVLITIILSVLTLDFYAGIQENVINDYDFEEDSAKWIVSGTTFGLPAYSGSKSAEITPGGYVAQTLPNIPVDEISSFSFWILDSNNASLDIIVSYKDEKTSVIEFSLGDTGLWSQKNVTGLTTGKFISKFNITNTDVSTNINVDTIDLSIAEIPDIAPIPEDPGDTGGIAYGAIMTMLFYVAIVFISGFIVLFIIKKGLMILLSYFYAIIMGISWFTFGLYYGSILLTYSVGVFNTIWESIPEFIQNFLIFLFETEVIPGELIVIEALLYFIAALLGLIGTISFAVKSFKRIWVRNVMMVFFGPMIGSMLAIHFGLLTVFLILIGLSLYDIYAVFRGPLKGIIDESRESAKENEYQAEEQEYDMSEVELVPLMPALPVYSTPLISIGLGDFAFFSMFVSAAVIISAELNNPIPLLMAVIGLLGGAYYTFQYLKEERALPGLPLPIFGGIGLLISGILIVMIFGGTSIEAILNLFG